MLRADESLSQEELTTALGVSSMWTAAHAYPLLPYSCVIMESIPESEAVMGVSPRQQAAVDEPAVKRSKVAGGGKETQGASCGLPRTPPSNTCKGSKRPPQRRISHEVKRPILVDWW